MLVIGKPLGLDSAITYCKILTQARLALALVLALALALARLRASLLKSSSRARGDIVLPLGLGLWASELEIQGGPLLQTGGALATAEKKTKKTQPLLVF